MNTNLQSVKYISCQQMANSEMREQVINLGKILVKELDLENSNDTLGRWMSHYIAELISTVDSSTGQDRNDLENKCFATILKLWEHRSTCPTGYRPMQNFESIYQTLYKLDPDNVNPYYYNNPLISEEQVTGDPNLQSLQHWLDMAERVDKIARVWMRYIFEQAAKYAVDDNDKVLLQNDIPRKEKDVSIILELLRENMYGEDEVTHESYLLQEENRIKNNIMRLEYFQDFNEALIGTYSKQLEDLKTT